MSDHEPGGENFAERWPRCCIGDAFEAVNGLAFKKGDWKTSGLPIIRIENLKNPHAKYNYWQGENNRLVHVAPGNLLFAWSGTPGTSFGAFLWNGPRGVLNQHIWRLDPRTDLLDLSFSQRALSLLVASFIDRAQGGVGLAHITKEKFSRAQVPVPTLNEQRRIVAKLDALQSRTRLAREALAAIPTLLDHYRQSVLTAAFLEAAPEFASVLDDEEPTSAATTTRTLLEVCDPNRGIPYGIVQTGQEHEGGIPTVRCGDIKDFKIAVSSLKHVDPAIVAQYARTTLLGGEVLIAIRGTVGQVSVASVEMRGMNISREVAMIPVLPTMDPWFVCYFLASPLGQRQVTDQVKGVAQQGINLGDLHKVRIPYIDLTRQQSVVAAIRRRLGFIKTIEEQIGSISVDHLEQSLLATAFRGELVPQDPADESASGLLDRIRAARVQADDAPRTRRHRTPAAATPSARAAEPTAPYHTDTADAYATLLAALRTQGSISSADAQASTGLDAAAVRPLLQRLVADGAAKVEGQKRGTRYVAIASSRKQSR